MCGTRRIAVRCLHVPKFDVLTHMTARRRQLAVLRLLTRVVSRALSIHARLCWLVLRTRRFSIHFHVAVVAGSSKE